MPDLLQLVFPAIITGVVGYIWLDIRTGKTSTDKKVNALEQDIENTYLPKKEHELQCKLISLELKDQLQLSVSNIAGQINLIKEQQDMGFKRLEELITKKNREVEKYEK